METKATAELLGVNELKAMDQRILEEFNMSIPIQVLFDDFISFVSTMDE